MSRTTVRTSVSPVWVTVNRQSPSLPAFTLTATSSGVRHVLEIGGTVGGSDGKQRYARVADKDRSDVFVLSAADTTRLTRDRAEYLMKK